MEHSTISINIYIKYYTAVYGYRKRSIFCVYNIVYITHYVCVLSYVHASVRMRVFVGVLVSMRLLQARMYRTEIRHNTINSFRTT